MALRTATTAMALVASSVFSTVALAQQTTGTTSGPAAGTNVEPSTAIQTEYEHRSVEGGRVEEIPLGTPAAAGLPGVEGSPGTQSGPAPK